MGLDVRIAFAAAVLALVFCPFTSGAQHSPSLGPAELQVDNLATPLGIDDPLPSFSWQLRDPGRGARQTAYEISIASSAAALGGAKSDVWSSGRVESATSLNVRYAGPALKPSTRYFWNVKVWGADGKAYPTSPASWFETGLMHQDAWSAEWIGYETPEEMAVRDAQAHWIASPDAKALIAEKSLPLRFAYRATVHLAKPVKHATLYATGQDTVAAWVNGTKVLKAQPFPAWHQMPWKKFVRADVTQQVQSGANTIALQSVMYTSHGENEAPPVIATLVVEYTDGAMLTVSSGTEWKTATHPTSGWEQKHFDDSAWKPAMVYSPAPGPTSAPLGRPWIPDSVKMLRHTFDVSEPIKSARLYATALGDYEMFLNGKRVSEDRLNPGWTDYRERVVYQTYDVTSLLAHGSNALGAMIAPGWYSTPLEWFQQPNNYGDTPPAVLAELRVEHTDGSVEWLKTGEQWQADASPILSSELYDGETQDARLQQPGWATSGFDGSAWHPALLVRPNDLRIEAQDYQPVRVERTMIPKTMTEPKPGVYVFDFGQNMAGVERIRVSGPKGTEVRVRFAEILNEDGTLYVENLRTAKATDHFILSGKGVEEFTPQFTFHGFRYAEITGLKTPPTKDSMRVLVLHTDAPFAAQLHTGSVMENKLWDSILWGQRSNFLSVPTDCPQRDERLGWMADAQVFWRTASYNMDLASFSRKFARDMRGTQAGTPFYGIYSPGTATEHAGSGAGWSDAGVIIPWTSWLQTGDTRIIDQNWDAMQEYVSAIESANPDFLWRNKSGIAFGDWLSPEGKTDQVLVATAYWAYDVTLMREMAHAIGRTGDEQRYAALFDKIRAAFQKRFVHDDGFVAGADNSPTSFSVNNPEARSKGGDTQTGYVLALHMNLLPANLRAAAAQKLVDKIAANHGLLATGFLGTPYLLEELTKAGHADVAYQLLLNTQYPSWGYLIEHGATTTWERWNGDKMKSDPSMNSYNHYAYGAVADWIYRYAAGVDATPLDAGFHTIVLHPVFDRRLGPVTFTYPSGYGTIRSDWTVQGNRVSWQITIPPNTTGFLSDAETAVWHLKLAKPASMEKATGPAGEQGTQLDPGTYAFVGSLK